jgi:hypothetical protein
MMPYIWVNSGHHMQRVEEVDKSSRDLANNKIARANGLMRDGDVCRIK